MGVLDFNFLGGVISVVLVVSLLEGIWNLIEEVEIRGVIVLILFDEEEVRVMMCDMNFIFRLWKFFDLVL